MVGESHVGAERLRLYAYATAPEASSYVAIMRLFAGALLAEWSAHDLAERGVDLPAELIDQRLRYLELNGNLLVSPREVRVTSIAEYQRQPARYTATSLGVRVHRQVEEVLAAAGGAREVPRELLAAVAHRLRCESLVCGRERCARWGSGAWPPFGAKPGRRGWRFRRRVRG